MPVNQEAVEFLQLVSEAETQNRSRGLEDLKFANGDQWPTYAIQSRGMERPQLTINETDSYCRQIENQQRQQRPRIKVHPVDGQSNQKVADVLSGIIRHVEVNSNADYAYDMAFSFALRMGWGYFRLFTDYTREDSFEQDIYIGAIENPFTVYFDPNSSLADGSDADRVLLTDVMSKDAFKLEYPGASTAEGFQARSTGDSTTEWITKEDIRLAEYFRVDKKASELVRLSNGDTMWKEDLPDADILRLSGIEIKGTRPSFKKIIKWTKCTAVEELESKEIPGRWIPVIPVYGRSVVLDGKRQRFGIVRDAKDPARMNNFWFTSMTESIALAPKAKWQVAEGGDEGYENEYAQANLSPKAVLHYKTKGVDGEPIEKPERVAPEPPPSGSIEAMGLATQAMQRVIGIFDPAMRNTGNVSGKALNAERQQSDQANFNFYDNLTISLRHCGRIQLGWAPTVYDTQRVMRIIGDDGKPGLVTLNEKKEVDGVQKVLHDVTVGEYDVVMDTGPGYNSKRQEAQAHFVELMSSELGKIIATVGADLVVRSFDGGPDMEVLADRLEAQNPLAQIDDKSDVPPSAQMKIKQLMQQVQQLQQQLQAAGLEIKYKTNIEQMRQDGETRRALMSETSAAHDREITQKQKQHDTETYALTAQNVAEINGLVKLLTSKTEHGQRLREMMLEFEHNTQLQDSQLAAKSEQKETVQ